jgi:4'-phosphopantetheinyl transferase
MDLDACPSGITYGACLDQDELDRARSQHCPGHAHRFIAAHGGLRHILARYTGQTPVELCFLASPFGKPVLANRPDNFPPLHFSMSHSGAHALCAVTSVEEIGVDVEQTRNLDVLAMAQRFFSEAEWRSLEDLPHPQMQDAFFACWTRKEAYVKAKGVGLAWPLNTFTVGQGKSGPVLLESRRAPDDVGRYVIADIPVAHGYKAAIAYRGSAGPPRIGAMNWG